MKTKLQQASRWAITIVTIMALTVLAVPRAWADESFKFAIAPMYEKIVLNPGDTFTNSFDVVNVPSSGSTIDYEAEVNCYFVDESHNNVYGEDSSWCDIKDWISIDSGGEGSLGVGEKNKLVYTINVPKDAAGGGQYATIMVTADVAREGADTTVEQDNNENVSTGIKEKKTIAYLIYAEVTGDVIRHGEIINADVPGFLLSGNIAGTSAIKNVGNTHGTATYKLQVFPLFSDEEIYTNEEDPETHTILPDRTLYNETAWEGTPDIGIFNVKYTVEFEGVTTEVTKMVIKCPIWLLFIIFFVIAAIVIWVIMRVRARSSSSKRKTTATE